jgi:diguanylate cyclase (GGDEF)-like protein
MRRFCFLILLGVVMVASGGRATFASSSLDPGIEEPPTQADRTPDTALARAPGPQSRARTSTPADGREDCNESSLKIAALENDALERRVFWLTVIVIVLGTVAAIQLYMLVWRAFRGPNRELDSESKRDEITGLWNRGTMREYLKKPESAIEIGRDRAVLLVDIDHFKQINETYEHAAGRAVLRAVAGRLRQALRESDRIARWGEEQFLIFMPAVQTGSLDAVVARVLKEVGSTPIRVGDHAIDVTVSGGFVFLPMTVGKQVVSCEQSLNIVDLLLQHAKSHGRNCAARLYSQAIASEVVRKIESDSPGSVALGKPEVEMVFGPAGRQKAPTAVA